MSKLLSIIGIPALCLLIGFGAGMITFKKLEKPVTYDCPDCVCPEQLPCNGIDFDKIKSKYITIKNTQYLTLKGDSILVDRLVEEIRKELKSVKCK